MVTARLGRERVRIDTVPVRFAEIGDAGAGIDEAVCSIEPLLELAARQEEVPNQRAGGPSRRLAIAERRAPPEPAESEDAFLVKT